jgi:hypothetical protein
MEGNLAPPGPRELGIERGGTTCRSHLRAHRRSGCAATEVADSDLAHRASREETIERPPPLRRMEQALMDRIVETLREPGAGFSFVGRQVHFDVGGDDFYLDCSDSRVIPIRRMSACGNAALSSACRNNAAAL